MWHGHSEAFWVDTRREKHWLRIHEMKRTPGRKDMEDYEDEHDTQ